MIGMITKALLKEYGVTLPASGCIFVKLLKKNKAVPCIILKVGNVNSTVQIKGVETKIPNEDIDFDIPDDD